MKADNNLGPHHSTRLFVYKVYKSIPEEYDELIDYNIPDSYGRTPYMYAIIGKKITEPLSKTILSYLLNMSWKFELSIKNIG